MPATKFDDNGIRLPVSYSQPLISKIEELCGCAVPPPSSEGIWHPSPLMPRLMKALSSGDAMLLWLYLGFWLRGDRLLIAAGGKGKHQQNAKEIRSLQRKELIVYDHERAIVVLDEENILALLNEIYPEGTVLPPWPDLSDMEG